jgi:hypothetical protein
MANKLQHVQFSDGSKMAEELAQPTGLHGILDQSQSAMLASLTGNEEKATVF